MTPLQKIGMGLVIVVLAANFGSGWDGLPNPIGWLLILSGVWDARGHLASATSLLVLGSIAFLVSVLTYPPQVTDSLDPGATWLLDLPQLSFEVVLCSTVAAVLGKRGVWFRWLTLLLVAVGVGPAVAIGADDPAIADGVLAGWVVAQLALIWLLFSVSSLPQMGARPRPVGGRPSDETHRPGNTDPESLS